MTWINLDDGILDHPKFIRAVHIGGSETVHLWLGLRSYCAKHLTDGHVPADMLDEVRGPKKRRNQAIEALVLVGLVDRVDDGLQLHDYLQWSESKEQIETKRRIAARRSALRASPELMRLIKDRDGSLCRYCGVSVDWADRRGPLGGTYDHVTPIAKGGSDDFENIVTACRGCNSRKQDRNLTECGMRLRPVGTTGSLPVGEPSSDLVPLQSTPNLTRSDPPVGPPVGDGPTAKVRKAREPKPPTWRRFPRDWVITAGCHELAQQLGVSAKAEHAKILDHEFRTPRSDPEATFRTWLRRAAEMAQERRPPGAVQHTDDRVERARLQRVLEQRRQRAQGETT